jgi:hypothetical protein
LLFGETTDTPSLTVVTPDSLRNKTVVRFKQRLSFPLLMIVLLTPSICCAYQEDFHYYVIYFLLRSKGFDANASHQIAGFSQYVDDNRKTEPIYQWPSTRAKFHFINSTRAHPTQRNDAVARSDVQSAFRLWMNGDESANYRLGWRLHVLADTFSHDTPTRLST